MQYIFVSNKNYNAQFSVNQNLSIELNKPLRQIYINDFYYQTSANIRKK